jgi:hypothetical protein
MFTNLYNLSGRAFVTFEEFSRNPMALVQKLERGDADSAGSTLRTIGIVALVLVIVSLIGAAVYTAASGSASQIENGANSFTFGN